jgi:AraC-like DNA-binding protein
LSHGSLALDDRSPSAKARIGCPRGILRRQFDETVIVRVTVESGRAEIPLGDATRWSVALVYAMSDVVVRWHATSKARLQRGDCLVVRQCSDLRAEAAGEGKVLVVLIPSCGPTLHRRVVDGPDGQVVSTHSGTALVVRHMLEGVAGQLADLDSENPGRLAHHVTGLLYLMLADAEGPRDRSSQLEHSKNYIEEHLADVDLTPGRVAVAQNMSIRTLHRLFEADDLTVRGWIRQRRLENCSLDLTDPALTHVPVSSVASRWGLWDAAHFSRIFKECYGLSPSAYRSAKAQTLGTRILGSDDLSVAESA